MFQKLILLLGVSVIAQATPASIGDATVWEKADVLIKALKTVVNADAEDATNRLNNLTEEVLEKSKKWYEAAQDEYTAEKLVLDDELEDLRELAGPLNKTDCVTAQEDELNKIYSRALSDMTNCIAMHLRRAEAIIENELNSIAGVRNVVSNREDRLSLCKATNDEECVEVVIGNIIVDISELPLIIKRSVDEASAVIAVLEKELKQCATDRKGLLTEQGNLVLKEMKQCIVDDENHDEIETLNF